MANERLYAEIKASPFGGSAHDRALGLRLWQDHVSNYISYDLQQETNFFCTASSPAYVRQAEGNGLAERAIRLLKEQLLRVRFFATVEELRLGWRPSPSNTTTDGCDSATDTRRQLKYGLHSADLKPKMSLDYSWPHNQR